MRQLTVLAVALGLQLVPVGVALASVAKAPPLYKNCTNLNKKHPHGVATAGAHDKTTGTPPVTNFTRSTNLYRLAMSYNPGPRPRPRRHSLREDLSALHQP